MSSRTDKPLKNKAALQSDVLFTAGDLVTNICAGEAKLEQFIFGYSLEQAHLCEVPSFLTH